MIEIRREKPGDVMGRWRLEKVIGQGGFGVVWAAEQLEPVRRRVALKVLKAGVDTDAVIERFQTERQALAMMDHPGVARVLDAGSTPAGRPFFVMDLLEGAPLLDYAAEKRLPVRARVELVRQVAAALQHAHQRGIIHRDLKPSNILVVETDGAPVVKVIDFGIARLMSDTTAMQTLAGQLWGTPAWMSPEQLAGLPVDVRTDVFSLGLVLYELLTGQPAPREAAAARDTSIPPPSRMLQKLPPKTLQTVASERAAAPSSLAGSLRGELDWIIQRATAAEPALRYESAAALRDDLAAYLSGDLVSAGPPSLSYQTRKFVRRHRGKLAAGTLAASLMLTGTVVSLFYARRAQEAQAATQDALWRSLLTEARALRQTGRPGQRLKALEAISAAARIRPSRELQDEAVAAMALPDFKTLGEVSVENLPPSGLADYAWEADVLVAGVRTDKALRRWRFLPASTLPPLMLPAWSEDITKFSIHPDGRSCMALLDSLRDVPLGLGRGMFLMETDTAAVRARIGDVTQSMSSPVYFDKGRRAAVVLASGGVAICDAATGLVQRRVMEQHKVHYVTADDRRGRLLITVAGSPSAWLLASDGESAPQPAPLAGSNLSAALSTDGRLAVVGGNGVTAAFDPGAAVNGYHSFAAIRPGHPGATSSAGIAGGGQYVITGGWDELVRLSTPALELRLIMQGRVRSISPAGERILVQNGGLFQLFETTLPTEFPCISDWVPLAQRSAAFHPAGGWATVSTVTRPATSNGAAIPAAASGTLLLRLPELEPVAFLGESHISAVFSESEPAVWTTGTGLKKWSLSVPDGPGPHRVREPLATLLQGLRTKSPAIASKAALIACVCEDKSISIRIHRIADGSSVLSIPMPDGAGDVEDVVIDPHGHWIAASYWRGAGVDVWSIPDGKRLLRLLDDQEFLRMSQSSDGKRLLVSGRSALHLWETGGWKCLQTIPVKASGEVPPRSALSPRGDLMAWEASDARVQLQKVGDDLPLLTLRFPFTGKFLDLTFAPDGETLAVCSVQDTWFCDLRQVRAHLTRLGL